MSTTAIDTPKPFAVRIPIAKRDAVQGIVYGWGALSTDAEGIPVIDSDNEYIPIDEIERAAHDLFRRSSGEGMGAAMHETMRVADLVASFPLDAAKREAYGFGKGIEGWMVGLAINDPATRERVFSGEWSELSIRGTAVAVDVEKLASSQQGVPRRFRKLTQLRLSDIEAVSFVDRGASGTKDTRPRIVLAKRDFMAQNVKKADVTGLQVIAELLESGKLDDLDEQKKAALLALIGGAGPKPADPVPAPPEMEMSEAAKAELKKRDEQVQNLAKQNADLQQVVAKMQADLEQGALVEFVKRDLSHLPSPGMSVEQVAKMVGNMRRNLAKADVEAFENILKAASEGIKKGTTLRAVGHGTSPAVAGGSAEDQIRTKAEEIRKAAGDKMSMGDAIVAAGKANPKLWAEYKSARRAG